MIKASVIGATGYTGVELVRILSSHPQVRLISLTSRSYQGEAMREIYPSLMGSVDLQCTAADYKQVISESDVVFVALPHGLSGEVVQEGLKQKKKVIDLGADFRFRDYRKYEEWYRAEHSNPTLTKEAVYGLPELHREKIIGANIVANPGCFPTSAILALAPALGNGLIESNTIIIDAKTGLSGAGRGASLTTHYGEVNENIHPYGVASHRHTPEIEQELNTLADEFFSVIFTPHLTPMTRGILSTCYAKLKPNVSEHQVRHVYQDFYAGQPFVHLLKLGQWPHTKWTYGSNNCLINLTVDNRTGSLIVCSAIDNLVKGAAGQAVQNMNLLFKLPETTGLNFNGIYP